MSLDYLFSGILILLAVIFISEVIIKDDTPFIIQEKLEPEIVIIWDGSNFIQGTLIATDVRIVE